jgi:hypothetical protein
MTVYCGELYQEESAVLIYLYSQKERAVQLRTESPVDSNLFLNVHVFCSLLSC